MACNSITSLLKSTCEVNNVGGITEIYIMDQEEILTKVIDNTTHTVTTLTVANGYSTFQFNKNVGNFTSEETRDLLVGNNNVKSTISIVLNARSGAKTAAIRTLGEGQRYLSIIVKSTNGTYTIFDDMQLINSNENSGTTRQEGSKYDIVFSNDSDNYPYFVDPTIIQALIL